MIFSVFDEYLVYFVERDGAKSTKGNKQGEINVAPDKRVAKERSRFAGWRDAFGQNGRESARRDSVRA